MQRKLILTNDGSHSVEMTDSHVTYHSIHGAIQESKHVFINSGLHAAADRSGSADLRIFEMGFGTGLNALLTLIEAEKMNWKVYYEAIDLFPLENAVIDSLNYCEQLHRKDLHRIFEDLHDCDWEKQTAISANFCLKKSKTDLLHFSGSKTDTPGTKCFALIYFDAFDPLFQPELWTEEIFRKMFSILAPGGILVTYSSKGTVRRAMEAAGFKVEKIPGPAGKREIVRAVIPV